MVKRCFYAVFTYRSLSGGAEVLKIKTGLVVRKIAGECVAVPTGAAAASVNGVISLSPSGELLIRKLLDGCEMDELIDALLERYDVSREQAETDVNTFVEKLREINLL